MSVQWLPPAPPAAPIPADPPIPFTWSQIDWMQLALVVAIAWSFSAPIALVAYLA